MRDWHGCCLRAGHAFRDHESQSFMAFYVFCIGTIDFIVAAVSKTRNSVADFDVINIGSSFNDEASEIATSDVGLGAWIPRSQGVLPVCRVQANSECLDEDVVRSQLFRVARDGVYLDTGTTLSAKSFEMGGYSDSSGRRHVAAVNVLKRATGE